LRSTWSAACFDVGGAIEVVPRNRSRQGRVSTRRHWACVLSLAAALAPSTALGQKTLPAPGLRGGPPAAWVFKKPGRETQNSKSVAERGGENPCNTPDPGFGAYRAWSREPTLGQMIVPQEAAPLAGGFDVMLHFHGHEAARKEWVRVMGRAVLVGIDLGNGSGPYAEAFADPEAFQRLVASVERAVARRAGVAKAPARRIGLSAWSAGYGSVGAILGQAYGRRAVDSVVLLDGLHSGYSQAALQLGPFIDFAREAASGRRFMFVSHSSIIPPGYASTTETANFLIWQLGGRPKPSRPRGSDPAGLELVSWYVRGGFHVRGYAGNDKLDHCAHLGLYHDVLKFHLLRRWK
jgi:hypothetical protein